MIGNQSAKTRFSDITERAGITFKHVASPEKKYIVESMSGGVALFDYDNDGYLDIYFVNSLTLDLVKSKQKTRSALYRNNGDGTFSDVTDKAGVGDVGWGMGVAVADYNKDGFDDILVTCFGPNHLFRTKATAPLQMLLRLRGSVLRDGQPQPRSSTTIMTADWTSSFQTTLILT